MADPILGPVSVTDVYRVSFIQRIYGQRILNVLHYKVTNVPAVDPPDRWAFMGSLGDYMTGAGKIQPLMLDAQSSDVTHEAIRVNRVNLLGPAVDPYFEVPLADPGLIDTPAGTGNVAVSIEKRATFEMGKPKQGIGRFQLGGVPQTSYEEGFITAGYLALVLPLAAEITEPVVTAGVTLSPALWGLNDVDTGHVNLIFGTSVKRTVRIMRRRTVGVGE